QGSEFIVRLPVATAAAAAPIPRRAGDPAAVPDGKRRILIVDDNRDAADSLGELLTLFGHEVSKADNGLNAVGAVAAFHPDTVLLDIGLPGMNGYEVARRIREQPGGTEILLVALTGWGQAEDRRRSQVAGFDHHLTKPLDLDLLRRLLAGT